jgi:hypothetical protein
MNTGIFPSESKGTVYTIDHSDVSDIPSLRLPTIRDLSHGPGLVRRREPELVFDEIWL